MKHCPSCKQIYTDETLQVCPRDSTRLAVIAGDTHSPVAPAERDKIFISYSHKDREWLKRLQIHLRPFFQQDDICAWDDGQIQPGTKWFEEIDSALARACVAVLLVTPDFLVSNFIQQVEWPRLKVVAENEGLQILWLAVRSSGVTETDISHYQALNNPAEPLAKVGEGLSEKAQREAQDEKLVDICRKIKERARPIKREREADDTGQSASKTLLPLRSFDVHLADIGPCIADTKGRLWVANAQQAKVYAISQERPAEMWLLPKLRWKGYLAKIWREHLMVADWSGSLYQFNAQSAAQELPFYQGHSDDLPMHLLAVGPEGQLVAAAWDGRIRVWDATGQPLNFDTPLIVPHLPLHLLPLAPHGVAVVDQTNQLRVYDATGREVWTWSAPQPVRSIWLLSDDGAMGPTFVVQMGPTGLAKLGVNGQVIEALEFDSPIVSVAHGLGRAGEEWIVVARAGGQLDWLSTSLFSVVRDNSLTLPCEAREVLVVHDPQQPAGLIALGLSSDGLLFTINERHVTMHATAQPVERLVPDPMGRFLFLQTGQEIGVYRNPAIMPARLRVDLAEPVEGKLVVNGFKRVIVKLKNTGDVAIHQVRAELNAAGIIDASRNLRPSTRPLAPGECVELEFPVRAKVLGDLPLELKVELVDEGGQLVTPVELNFSLESVTAG